MARRPRVGFVQFWKKLYRSWQEDAVGTTAAALTYYGILSLFPFLLFLVALAGLALDPKATAELVQQVGRFAPGPVTQILEARLTSLQQSASGKLLTVGIVGAIWAASGAVTMLMQALNRCYDVRETRPFWKTRALAIGVTLGAGVVAVLASAVTFFVPLVGAAIGGRAGAAVTWLRFPVAGAIMIALFAVLYWVLPNVRPRFQWITPGSVAAVVLWLLASWGFSEYVRHSKSYEATYGTLGGVIVLLVWMWLSSVVVLLGAEINKILTPSEALERAITGEARVGPEARPIGLDDGHGQPQPT